MKVFVVGSNGQIGQQLIQLLKNSEEHTVLAMVRKQEQADQLATQGVETVLADLEGTVDSIADAAMGSDAIVFAAGSGGTTGHDKTLLIDLDGAGKTIEAAQKQVLIDLSWSVQFRPITVQTGMIISCRTMQRSTMLTKCWNLAD